MYIVGRLPRLTFSKELSVFIASSITPLRPRRSSIYGTAASPNGICCLCRVRCAPTCRRIHRCRFVGRQVARHVGRGPRSAVCSDRNGRHGRTVVSKCPESRRNSHRQRYILYRYCRRNSNNGSTYREDMWLWPWPFIITMRLH